MSKIFLPILFGNNTNYFWFEKKKKKKKKFVALSEWIKQRKSKKILFRKFLPLFSICRESFVLILEKLREFLPYISRFIRIILPNYFWIFVNTWTFIENRLKKGSISVKKEFDEKFSKKKRAKKVDKRHFAKEFTTK